MALKSYIVSNEILRNLKIFLMIFHTTSCLLAMVILALALFFRFDWDTKHYIQILEAEFLWNGSYILMVSSGLVIICSLLGCWATANEHPGLCRVNAWVLVGLFVLELSGLAYSLDWGTFRSKVTDWILDKMLTLIDQMNFDPKVARIVNVIQEKVGCCGANDWLDYDRRNIAMPNECRDPDNGNQWDLGCDEQFTYWVQDRVAWMSGIALALAVFQIFGVIANFWLRHIVQRIIVAGGEYQLPSKSSQI